MNKNPFLTEPPAIGPKVSQELLFEPKPQKDKQQEVTNRLQREIFFRKNEKK
jgi:hypothetical protein